MHTMAVTKGEQKDPYRLLGLPHSANAAEIKKAYREMARTYHPDRFAGTAQESQQQAASIFAAGASAYALLSDPKRKAAYDHVYKYGGYDHVDEDTGTKRSSSAPYADEDTTSRKRKTAIGYNCIDPFAFILTKGRIQTRRTTAGIEIPPRVNNLGDVRFAFSSGQVMRTRSGRQTCERRTTEYSRGQKFCRAERITLHPDGRKEVVVNHGPDAFESVEATTAQQQSMFDPLGEQPWWVNAWQEVREKLTMCNNPCAVVTSH